MLIEKEKLIILLEDDEIKGIFWIENELLLVLLLLSLLLSLLLISSFEIDSFVECFAIFVKASTILVCFQVIYVFKTWFQIFIKDLITFPTFSRPTNKSFVLKHCWLALYLSLQNKNRLQMRFFIHNHKNFTLNVLK
jgi:hypothetical protein